nr:hypothetical secreted protein, containing PKD domain [uncultured archaeon]
MRKIVAIGMIVVAVIALVALVALVAAFAGYTYITKEEVNVTESKKSAELILTGIEMEAIPGMGVYKIAGDINNAGLKAAKSVIMRVGEKEGIKATHPYKPYFVGLLNPDDFISFELKVKIEGNVTEVPLVIEYKDENGNLFSKTEYISIEQLQKTPPPKTTPTTLSPEQPLAPLPYQVMDHIPEPGAKDVPVTTHISINFSKLPGIVELEMEPEVEISNISKEVLTTPCRDFVLIDAGKVTFYLAKPLLPETNYTVKISYGEEKTHEGMHLTSNVTWQFTTSPAIQKPIISVNSSVFEGERWMSIHSDGKVTCYSDHYYPDYKEITIKEGYISREEIDTFLELFSNFSEYSEYTVNASEQLIGRDHMDCVFLPFGDAKISCIPLNKTLRLRVRPPSFPEPETVTITAKEIVERIDRIYREAEVSERRKEINPYLISLNLEPYAPSYQPNQMIAFNASLMDVSWLGKKVLYEWDFGDGSKKGYGKIVRHSYSSPGNYTIRLKITSEDVVGIKDETVAIRSTPAPVIWIEKKVNPEVEHGAAMTGGEVTITIELKNRRDKEIFDREVRDGFPDGFELISGDTSMYLRALKPGESKILKYELRALEAGYSVLKPATLTYKDESGVQYSNELNIAEVMVRAPPPGPPMDTIGRVA